MRIEEAQLEQSIINLIKTKDRGVELSEILKEVTSESSDITEALSRLKSVSCLLSTGTKSLFLYP